MLGLIGLLLVNNAVGKQSGSGTVHGSYGGRLNQRLYVLVLLAIATISIG